ncbi:MAG: hypothetical protein ACOY41_08490 [Pseudomonadota bacterium]
MIDAAKIKLYQIFYSEETRRLLDPVFIPLDNLDNPRPDWAEYWPIRNLFLSTPFSDDDYVGIFSPRFSEKTGVNGQFVLDAVQSGTADIYSFSPSFDQSAIHLSPFEQGERKHPGLISATAELLSVLGIALDPKRLICDHSTTIFANYFVARYSIWKAWLEIAERIFDICESGTLEISKRLNEATRHRGVDDYPMKIFIMERLITILLEKEGLHARLCLDITKMPTAKPQAASLLGYMVICDALKGQYLRTKHAVFLEQYKNIQSQIFKVLYAA